MTRGELEERSRLHVRYCECDECLPGCPTPPTRVYLRGRKYTYSSLKERKSAENKRAYLRRTGLGHLVA